MTLGNVRICGPVTVVRITLTTQWLYYLCRGLRANEVKIVHHGDQLQPQRERRRGWFNSNQRIRHAREPGGFRINPVSACAQLFTLHEILPPRRHAENDPAESVLAKQFQSFV